MASSSNPREKRWRIGFENHNLYVASFYLARHIFVEYFEKFFLF